MEGRWDADWAELGEIFRVFVKAEQITVGEVGLDLRRELTSVDKVEDGADVLVDFRDVEGNKFHEGIHGISVGASASLAR